MSADRGSEKIRRYRVEYEISVPEGSLLDQSDRDGSAFNDCISHFLEEVKKLGGGFHGSVRVIR